MSAAWYYAKGGQQIGPVSQAAVEELARSGSLSPDDLVWHKELTAWTPAGQIDGLFPSASQSPDASAAVPPPLPQRAVAVTPQTPPASPPQTSPASGLQAKWQAVYGRPLDLLTLLTVELFHRLVPVHRSLYSFPNIPARKLSNAESKYAKLGPTELLLGLVDATVFGSASDGFVLTTEGVHWHNPAADTGHRTYTEIHPQNVAAKETFTTRSVTLDPTAQVWTATIDKKLAEGIAAFIKHAAAFAVAAKGRGEPAHAAALSSLSEASAKGGLDAAISALSTQLPDGIASSNAGPAKPLSSKTFQRAKENLECLQADIATWFRDQQFQTTTRTGDNQWLVQAAKESGLRSLLGTRQKYLVKIVRCDAAYTVELGYGTLDEKGVVGGLSTFFVNYSTLGVPYLVGLAESGSVEKRFGQWLEGRSANVCPACEQSAARQEMGQKTLSLTENVESHHGDDHEIQRRAYTNEFNCRFCGHVWNDGTHETTMARVECPDGHTANYDIDLLAPDGSLRCPHCDCEFFTQTQQRARERDEIEQRIRIIELDMYKAIRNHDTLLMSNLRREMDEVQRRADELESD